MCIRDRCVWFLCYIVGAVGVMFRNHRKLYDLKIQYRWGMLGEDTEESTAMTGVDTKTMMHSERTVSYTHLCLEFNIRVFKRPL